MAGTALLARRRARRSERLRELNDVPPLRSTGVTPSNVLVIDRLYPIDWESASRRARSMSCARPTSGRRNLARVLPHWRRWPAPARRAGPAASTRLLGLRWLMIVQWTGSEKVGPSFGTSAPRSRLTDTAMSSSPHRRDGLIAAPARRCHGGLCAVPALGWPAWVTTCGTWRTPANGPTTFGAAVGASAVSDCRATLCLSR